MGQKLVIPNTINNHHPHLYLPSLNKLFYHSKIYPYMVFPYPFIASIPSIPSIPSVTPNSLP